MDPKQRTEALKEGRVLADGLRKLLVADVAVVVVIQQLVKLSHHEHA